MKRNQPGNIIKFSIILSAAFLMSMQAVQAEVVNCPEVKEIVSTPDTHAIPNTPYGTPDTHGSRKYEGEEKGEETGRSFKFRGIYKDEDEVKFSSHGSATRDSKGLLCRYLVKGWGGHNLELYLDEVEAKNCTVNFQGSNNYFDCKKPK